MLSAGSGFSFVADIPKTFTHPLLTYQWDKSGCTAWFFFSLVAGKQDKETIPGGAHTFYSVFRLTAGLTIAARIT